MEGGCEVFSRGGVCGLKWRFWGVWGGFCDGGMH